MISKKLILKFDDKNEEYCFTEKISIIEDKNLIKELSKTNIQNSDSLLFIKSEDNLPIYEVIQFKINVTDTCVFLVNFKKENIDENARKDLVEKVSTLKTKGVQTIEDQLNKIEKLLKIIREFNPIFISYYQSGDLIIKNTDLLAIINKIDIDFPIIILAKEEKEHTKPKKQMPTLFDFPMFKVDYLFVMLFSILFSYALYSGIFEILNKQSISVFLLILAFVFYIIMCVSYREALFEKFEIKYKKLKYWLLVYGIIGIAIGSIAAFFISKFVLKNEVESINFSTINIWSPVGSFVLVILSLFVTQLINLIMIKINKISKK